MGWWLQPNGRLWSKRKPGVQVPSLSLHPSTLPWPLPTELQLFPFLFPLTPDGGKKISFADLRKERNIPSWEKEKKREAASPSAPSLWGRQTTQVVPGGGLAEEHSHWANSGPKQLPPLPYLHPDPALYPCFLRNNYPKTELKSIS